MSGQIHRGQVKVKGSVSSNKELTEPFFNVLSVPGKDVYPFSMCLLTQFRNNRTKLLFFTSPRMGLELRNSCFVSGEGHGVFEAGGKAEVAGRALVLLANELAGTFLKCTF